MLRQEVLVLPVPWESLAAQVDGVLEEVREAHRRRRVVEVAGGDVGARGREGDGLVLDGDGPDAVWEAVLFLFFWRGGVEALTLDAAGGARRVAIGAVRFALSPLLRSIAHVKALYTLTSALGVIIASLLDDAIRQMGRQRLLW